MTVFLILSYFVTYHSYFINVHSRFTVILFKAICSRSCFDMYFLLDFYAPILCPSTFLFFTQYFVISELVDRCDLQLSYYLFIVLLLYCKLSH